MTQEKIELRKAFFKKSRNINHSVAFFAPKRYPQTGESLPITTSCGGCTGSCLAGCTAFGSATCEYCSGTCLGKRTAFGSATGPY